MTPGGMAPGKPSTFSRGHQPCGNAATGYRVRNKSRKSTGASAMLEIVPCQSCAGPTTFSIELEPLGSEPGHRVYYCESCHRYTWTTVWVTHEEPAGKQRSGVG